MRVARLQDPPSLGVAGVDVHGVLGIGGIVLGHRDQDVAAPRDVRFRCSRIDTILGLEHVVIVPPRLLVSLNLVHLQRQDAVEHGHAHPRTLADDQYAVPVTVHVSPLGDGVVRVRRQHRPHPPAHTERDATERRLGGRAAVPKLHARRVRKALAQIVIPPMPPEVPRRRKVDGRRLCRRPLPCGQGVAIGVHVHDLAVAALRRRSQASAHEGVHLQVVALVGRLAQRDPDRRDRAFAGAARREQRAVLGRPDADRVVRVVQRHPLPHLPDPMAEHDRVAANGSAVHHHLGRDRHAPLQRGDWREHARLARVHVNEASRLNVICGRGREQDAARRVAARALRRRDPEAHVARLCHRQPYGHALERASRERVLHAPVPSAVRIHGEHRRGVALQRRESAAAVRQRAVRHHQLGRRFEQGHVDVAAHLIEQLAKVAVVRAVRPRRYAGRGERGRLEAFGVATGVDGLLPETARLQQRSEVLRGVVHPTKGFPVLRLPKQVAHDRHQHVVVEQAKEGPGRARSLWHRHIRIQEGPKQRTRRHRTCAYTFIPTSAKFRAYFVFCIKLPPCTLW